MCFTFLTHSSPSSSRTGAGEIVAVLLAGASVAAGLRVAWAWGFVLLEDRSDLEGHSGGGTGGSSGGLWGGAGDRGSCSGSAGGVGPFSGGWLLCCNGGGGRGHGASGSGSDSGCSSGDSGSGGGEEWKNRGT